MGGRQYKRRHFEPGVLVGVGQPLPGRTKSGKISRKARPGGQLVAPVSVKGGVAEISAERLVRYTRAAIERQARATGLARNTRMSARRKAATRRLAEILTARALRTGEGLFIDREGAKRGVTVRIKGRPTTTRYTRKTGAVTKRTLTPAQRAAAESRRKTTQPTKRPTKKASSQRAGGARTTPTTTPQKRVPKKQKS